MDERGPDIVVFHFLQDKVRGVITPAPLVRYPRVERGGIEDVRRFRQARVPSRIHSYLRSTERLAGFCVIINACELVFQ